MCTASFGRQLYEVRLLLLSEVLLWLWIVFPCLKQVLQLSDSDIPYGFAYRLPFLHHALPACPAYLSSLKHPPVLQQAVQGITDLINLPALINLDFADVQTVMKDKGMAHIGIGSAQGDDKAIEAVKLAVASPLLETKINGATHVIINISGDISLMDANDAASYVQDLAGENANIIFGAKFDESMTDQAGVASGYLYMHVQVNVYCFFWQAAV
jgi:hypothetical protein